MRIGPSILSIVLAAGCVRPNGPSPESTTPQIQFVTVEDDVRLEVIDWGGEGRPLVLLAGSGNTAHVFDGFAPKLTACCHVYGITRRGYGASSQPTSGYDDQRLADDVFQVLNSLSIKSPVLVGHSMAGGELTTVGNEHSDRLAGLVYLDALGDPRDFPASDPAYMALFEKLPAAMRTPPTPPSQEELRSFRGYRAWQLRSQKFAFPESELRNMFATNPDGSMGPFKTPQRVSNAIGAGQKRRDYSGIRVPVLALFEFPRPDDDPPDYRPKTNEERASIQAFSRATAVFTERWVRNLKSGVPNARVVDTPRAGHYVFLTREAEVLQELQKFMAGLRN